MMDSFGLKIEKTDGERYENLEYAFPHYGLILLVNKQGIVERSYPRGPEYGHRSARGRFRTGGHCVRRRDLLAGLASVGALGGAGAVATGAFPTRSAETSSAAARPTVTERSRSSR